MLTVTVSQINRYLKALLDEDKKLAEIYVKGEISNFSRHYQSGHCYFTIKDAQSAIRAVMFRGYAQDLRFQPENGMAVLVRASVSVYERDGSCQLYVTDLQPDGAGALAVAFDQLKSRLQKRGLFDEIYKKPLPHSPSRIGIVTSQTGAALQDILSVLERRYPLCTAVISPAPVQGADAPVKLTKALEDLDQRGNCDVIILGRGGGSMEDLWCFNDENLAIAVFHCNTPVVSAVGHETDFTICDFVADVRAPTPSAAAELATPSVQELSQQVTRLRDTMVDFMEGRLYHATNRLAQVSQSRALRSPLEYVAKNQEKLDFSQKALYNRKRIFIQQYADKLAAKGALLNSLSPLRVLDRGYAIAQKDGKVIRSVESLSQDDRIDVKFSDGCAVAKVERIDKEGTSG